MVPSGTARATAGLMTLLFLITILNAAYVAALPSATIFYVANVLLHVVLGAATAAFLVWRAYARLGLRPAAEHEAGLGLAEGGYLDPATSLNAHR